jgi:starch synthase (maltosyl-transferring)
MVAAAADRAGSKRIPDKAAVDFLLSEDVAALMNEWGPRADITRLGRELEVVVDRKEACFASWYEMFPRSQGSVVGRSATFKD